MIRVPTVEEEQRRGWPRQRKQLQGQRLRLAFQGRGLVLTQGIALDNLWWQEAKWKGHQKELAPWLLPHLEIFRKINLALDEQIKQIDQKIVAERKTRAEPKPNYAGDASLKVIEAEVCDWKRLGSWRKAGSYCGLTGGVSASGQAHFRSEHH